MKTLTFNMGWAYCNLKRVREYLVDGQPDLVFFQEGVKFGPYDSIVKISHGWEVETDMMHGNWLWGWKLGILSKKKILHYKTAKIWKPSGWNRTVQGVCLDGGIRAVNLHHTSGCSDSDHERQIRATIAFLDSLPISNPSMDIIAGDFNLKLKDTPINLLYDAGFRHVAGVTVDHIFVRHATPVGSEVVLEGASDVEGHKGIVGYLE